VKIDPLLLLLMLAVSRRLVWQHEDVIAGRWRGNDFSSIMLYELEDKTLGIVGLGNIGKKVARLAQAFHMRGQYYDVPWLSGDAEDALGVRFALFPSYCGAPTSSLCTCRSMPRPTN